MAKYRKKPVVIEAEPYRRGSEDGFKCMHLLETGVSCKGEGDICDKCTFNRPYIDTLEGKMLIEPTDMIITGVKGERYPCKKDIFDMTYEKVEG
jgi:hypothetical protein